MNHQGVSEIVFEEVYRVPPEQTARALFARLPHGRDYAADLIECLATGYLVSVAESICIREMQRHIDTATEVVVGRAIRLEHRGPIPAGSALTLRGWLERLGERSATFCVQASDAHEIVAESLITLVAARRASMESRIRTKVQALSAARSNAPMVPYRMGHADVLVDTGGRSPPPTAVHQQAIRLAPS